MQQKMQVLNVNYGNEQLWKEKFKAANGKAWHALMNGPVSFFLKWGRGVFCFFPFVPNVFSSSSQSVANSTSVLSHMVYPKAQLPCI
jgi:hypothetical protein